MDLKPRLLAQAKQSITITPRVIQSIKLLKFGHDELCAYLKEQEERNPLIEVVLPEPRSAVEDTLRKNVDETAWQQDGSADSNERELKPTVTPKLGAASGSRGVLHDGDLRTIEETFASACTLREVLLQQVDLNIHSNAERLVAAEIVESIDPDGYLRRELDEIADCMELDEEFVEAVLAQVQRFEPTGVGARSVSECLKLQLEENGPVSTAMSVLLDNLDLLARYDLPGLAKACRVGQQEVAAMVSKIRQLDPRPGKKFDCEAVIPAMPDVNVALREDGSCHVELNSALLPKVLINREYYAEMCSVATAEDDMRFVADCMKDANWLARNVDQRAKTLLKVASEIVKRQKDFLIHGVKHIKPLCQGDVADTLGIHRSTVCRAMSGKYMMTNRGLFELKYFFSNSLTSNDGDEAYSTESIRARIRQLVDTEPNNKALSDDAIMAVLREDGVEIARRTVAKYREMMSIPSSSVRMRQRRAEKMEMMTCSA